MMLVKCAVVLALYMVLFWIFGDLVALFCEKQNTPMSKGLKMVLGFFAYYAIFQVVAVPVMFLKQPLSRLTMIWSGIVVLIIGFYAMYRSHHKEKVVMAQVGGNKKIGEFFWELVPYLVAVANIFIVSVIFTSYWDATYYVGNVSYAVYTDTINIYDPLYGTMMSQFDLKHCLATYHVHDAVVCQLLGIHPLVQTKTIMVIVITVVLNMVYMQVAKRLFPKDLCAQGLMMGFCLLINLCTYSAYTSSSFIMLRTYEGKAISATIVAGMLFYWLLCLIKHNDPAVWKYVFVTVWGSVAVSSSAIFITVLGVCMLTAVVSVKYRDSKILLRGILCMIPAFVVLGAYVMNRIGFLRVLI